MSSKKLVPFCLLDALEEDLLRGRAVAVVIARHKLFQTVLQLIPFHRRIAQSAGRHCMYCTFALFPTKSPTSHTTYNTP